MIAFAGNLAARIVEFIAQRSLYLQRNPARHRPIARSAADPSLLGIPEPLFGGIRIGVQAAFERHQGKGGAVLLVVVIQGIVPPGPVFLLTVEHQFG